MGGVDVAVVGCRDYHREVVEASVGRLFDLVGGPAEVAGRGSSVFVKVNGLIPAEPESGITTHPEVVRAIVLRLKEVTDTITIGDSPGGIFNRTMLKRVYDKCGYAAVADETGAKLNFDTSARQVTLPGASTLKSITVCGAMAAADHLVSVSKFKTHMFMNITAAIKNLFGAVPGMTKFAFHSRFNREEDFADLLLDVALAADPSFNFIDAVTVMDGNGPRAGDIKWMNVLAAGRSAVDLDTLMMSLIGVEPGANRPLCAAMARGLTTGDVSDLRVAGDDVEGLKIEGFALPSKKDISTRIPAGLQDRFGRLMAVRPKPSPDRCTACRKCADICPEGAITIKDKVAVVDLDRCIRCYCCHELCEFDAIDLQRPALLRLATRIAG